jgi:hypothetical protein
VKERFDKNWDDLARQVGYANRHDMLFNMYVEQGLSLKEIGQRIGASGHAVMRQLDKLFIERRSRGGFNNLAGQTRKLHRLDQRVIMRYNLDATAKLVGVSTSLLYKYRRAINEEDVWNSVSCAQPTNLSDTQP